MTCHIHITGLVQGVGFRPFVARLASETGVAGSVSNGRDGVHIYCSADRDVIQRFLNVLQSNPPMGSKVTGFRLEELPDKSFSGFEIVDSETGALPNLIFTPDKAMCLTCKKEINDRNNRRYGYAFTTCLHCGPRYSITHNLPYDRANTTMSAWSMCPACKNEFTDPSDRRYWSQTNSCPECAISMHIRKGHDTMSFGQDEIVPFIAERLIKQEIVAVKGVGGYLLLCDATDRSAVMELRRRKNRLEKPLAVLYPNTDMVADDVFLRPYEKEELLGPVSPIVLLPFRQNCPSGIAREALAPGLGRLGVMVPYAPLLGLIAEAAGRPMVATSANISGSPIFYKDTDAVAGLNGIADYVLIHDRDIIMPEDDSIVQYTARGRRIILRRGRGLAPGISGSDHFKKEGVIGLGADLKSAFALASGDNIYISQYLGNQDNSVSQDYYNATLTHLLDITAADVKTAVCDLHPGYYVHSHLSYLESRFPGLRTATVQHHLAHFASLLAEHGLLVSKEPVLGIVWDGTGYGTDGNIWGSENFIFENKSIRHAGQLKPFPVLAGDMMSKNTALSALSLLYASGFDTGILHGYFDDKKWDLYRKMLEKPAVMTSSMGRIFDAVAFLLGVVSYNDYEGEAAMKLEHLATRYPGTDDGLYRFEVLKGNVHYDKFFSGLINDIDRGMEKEKIAWKFHRSLAHLVDQLAGYFHVTKVGLSGGVFQNSLLTDMIFDEMKHVNVLIHKELSPNDENIGFGQLAAFAIQNSGLIQKNEKLKIQCV